MPYKRNYRGKKNRRKTRSQGTSTRTLAKKVDKIQRKINRGDFKKLRIEYQGFQQIMDGGWNRRTLIEPSTLNNTTPSTRTWKYVFGQTVSNTDLAEKADCYIHKLKLTQHFNLRALQSPTTQTMPDAPVVLHNYVVSLKQDFGSAWKNYAAPPSISSGYYDPSYLTEDLHYAKLGDAFASSVVGDSNMFFLNKKLFNVHAEHHHTFAPFWLKQALATSTVSPVFQNANAIGPATSKSAYMVTYTDNIKLNIKLTARGNKSLFPALTPPIPPLELGWTGIPTTDIPATDQLFILTWCSQGGAGVVGSYDIEQRVGGIFNVTC